MATCFTIDKQRNRERQRQQHRQRFGEKERVNERSSGEGRMNFELN